LPRKSIINKSSGEQEAPAVDIREPIKQMTGHANEEEMAASLPENTMTATPEEDRPRRKRRSKEEMAAARGESAPAPMADGDPLLNDPLYQKYMKDFQAFGGGGAVKGAFNIGAPVFKASPLDEKEEKKVDGFFYCASKRFNFGDPFKNWFTASILFVGMLSSFIVSRVVEVKGNEIQEHFARLFGMKKEEEEEKEGDA
jgi:hypothetical protein